MSSKTLRLAALGAAALLTLAACANGEDDVATAVPGGDDPAAATTEVATSVPDAESPAPVDATPVPEAEE
jgi:hypothetical protein